MLQWRSMFEFGEYVRSIVPCDAVVDHKDIESCESSLSVSVVPLVGIQFDVAEYNRTQQHEHYCYYKYHADPLWR